MKYEVLRKVIIVLSLVLVASTLFINTTYAQGTSRCLQLVDGSGCGTFLESCEVGYISSCSSFGVNDCPSGETVCIRDPNDPLTPGGIEEEETVTLDLAERTANLYSWSLGIGVMLALGVLVFAGFLYVTSSGNPSRMGEAKKWITAAVAGLIVLFSSYFILSTINPGLTNLESIVLSINKAGKFIPPKFTLPEPTDTSAFSGTFTCAWSSTLQTCTTASVNQCSIGYVPQPRECYRFDDPESCNNSYLTGQQPQCVIEPHCVDECIAFGISEAICNANYPTCPELACPQKSRPVGYSNSYLYVRPSGEVHTGIDIFARVNQEVVAIVDGIIWEMNTYPRGGITLKLEDPITGLTYFYEHLAGYAPGLEIGDRVFAGQTIGYNDNTGNAVGTCAHIHFEVRVGRTQTHVSPFEILNRACGGGGDNFGICERGGDYGY